MRVFLCLSVLAGGLAASGEESKPFADYSKKTREYLERVQQGEQRHAFKGGGDFTRWQAEARAALVRVTGLERMRGELSSFRPRVTEGPVVEVGESHYRSLCTIETEPGVSIPFYLLVPRVAGKGGRFPLFLCPHGHDRLGLHSYAGVYRDDAHREKILGREGNIAELSADPQNLRHP